MNDPTNNGRASLPRDTVLSSTQEEVIRSRPPAIVQKYDNVTVENSNAVFGNVDQSTHNYYYLPTDSRSLQSSSRKRRRDPDGESVAARQLQESTSTVLSALIESLSFDGIWERHGTIVTAHPKTCEWILPVQNEALVTETAGDEARTQEKVAFSQWLESNENYFWIRGAAGSGKSTLVSYIVQNQVDVRTRLRPWASSQNVTFASFFFWRYGRFLQKSINGMLRTLLIQVLQQAPNAFESLIADLPDYQQKVWLSRSSTPFSRPWSQADLVKLLHNAINSSNNKICFLIDALDEFHAYDGRDHLDPHEAALHEDMHALLDIIKNLWEMPNVKVCIASRPGNVFDLAFANTQLLDLERLNENDIRIYAHGKLGLRLTKELANVLSRSLMYRSQGIFLWVKLAVDSLLNGAVNGDTLEDLEQRLDELPAGLESMYGRMLQNLDQRYRDDATTIFSLVDCLKHCLNFFRTPNAMLLFLCRTSFSSTLVKGPFMLTSTYMAKVLNSRSCGLLHMVRYEFFEKGDTKTGWALMTEPRDLASLDVAFVHRTAQDYVRKHITNCNFELVPGGGTLEGVPMNYGIAMIEGSIRYLEFLHQSHSEGVHDEEFLAQAFFGNQQFPFTSGQIYFVCLRLLSKTYLSSNTSDDAHTYLDRLSVIPLISVNPTLFTWLGIHDDHIPEVLNWLGHLSHFANHGFVDYTLTKIKQSGTHPVGSISYLLYFALLWSVRTPAEGDHCEDWMIELQSMLKRFENGDIYLQRIWTAFLTDQSGRSKGLDLRMEDYTALVQAFKCSSFRPQEPLFLFLNEEQGFLLRQSIWKVAVSPGLLLHPLIIQVTQNCSSDNRSQFFEECVQLFDRMLPTWRWPRDSYIIHYYDPWLQLDFPVTADQSTWITNDMSGTWRTCDYKDYEAERFRLGWVMLYGLAQYSGTLSHDVSWTSYIRRIEEVFDYDIHNHLSQSRCSTNSCSVCACARSFQIVDQDCERYNRSLLSKPCPRDFCWSCECRTSAFKNRCPGLGAGCRCLVDRRIFATLCDDACEGCSCTRSIYTKWLRRVLHEDELNWEDWYNILVCKYGLREKNLTGA